MGRYVPRSHKGWDAIREVKRFVSLRVMEDSGTPTLSLQYLRESFSGFENVRWRAMIRSLVVNGIDSVE